jgi:hypothetical protein
MLHDRMSIRDDQFGFVQRRDTQHALQAVLQTIAPRFTLGVKASRRMREFTRRRATQILRA